MRQKRPSEYPAWKASRPSRTSKLADVFPIASSRREAQGPSIPQRLGWIVKFSLTVGVDIVNDIKRLFLEFQSAVVSFHQTLKRELGGKNFIVKDRDGKFLLFAGPADKSALAQSRIGRSPSAGAVSRRSRKRRRGNQRPCAKSRPSSLSFVSRRRRCRYPIVRIFVISPRDASARRSKMTAPCRMAMSRAAAKACRVSSMLPRPSASRHSPRRR